VIGEAGQVVEVIEGGEEAFAAAEACGPSALEGTILADEVAGAGSKAGGLVGKVEDLPEEDKVLVDGGDLLPAGGGMQGFEGELDLASGGVDGMRRTRGVQPMRDCILIVGLRAATKRRSHFRFTIYV
jgi:hypothetical protein